VAAAANGGGSGDYSGEVRETSFLFQRCSVLVQRFNAVLLAPSGIYLPRFKIIIIIIAVTIVTFLKRHVML